MSSSVEKIKERLSIDQVIGAYIKIEKAGSNYKARCPFHNEKTPSFFISPARGSYYCFGCSAKGDIFSFVQEFEGLDFVGSLKVLAEKAGVELVQENVKSKSERERLFSCLEAATAFYEKSLVANSEAYEYVRSRGLTEKTIGEWNIGFAVNDWRVLVTHLREKGFNESDMEKVGLIKRPEGNTPYDTFRGRIMFPICDSSGRVVAFSGRIMPRLDDGKTGKYVNSPETELFNKSSLLYGFDKAKNAIRLKNYVILVEGQLDLIMSHQAGYQNTVASSGTALTEGHLALMKRLTDNLLLAYDADKAGIAASERATKLALKMGFTVKNVFIEGGKDPADLIFKDPQLWVETLKNSKHIVDYYLDNLLAENLDKKKLGDEVRKKVLPFVALTESSIEQSRLVDAISIRTGFRTDAIWDDLKKIPREDEAVTTTATAPQSLPERKSRKSSIERKIFGILYWQSQQAVKKVDTEHIRKRLGEILGEDEFGKLDILLSESRNDLVFETEIAYENSLKLVKEVDDFLINLELDTLKERLTDVMDELHKAEASKDSERAEIILRRCQEISLRISTLVAQSKK
jgi:DNA primase